MIRAGHGPAQMRTTVIDIETGELIEMESDNTTGTCMETAKTIHIPGMRSQKGTGIGRELHTSTGKGTQLMELAVQQSLRQMRLLSLMRVWYWRSGSALGSTSKSAPSHPCCQTILAISD